MNPFFTLKLSAVCLALLLTGCGSETDSEPDGTPAAEEQGDKNSGGPNDGTPDDGNPDDGHPDDGNPDDGNPDDGNPDDGNPDDGNPDDGNPDDGNPDDGNPNDGNPDDGNPDDGNPDDGNPDDGNPDDGNPDDGNPEPPITATMTQLGLNHQVPFQPGETLAIRHACADCNDALTKLEWFADEATTPFFSGVEYTLSNDDMARTLTVVATPYDANETAGTPKQIQFKKTKFVELFATRSAFAGLTEEGRVYTWGEADCGGESYGLDLTDIQNVYAFDCTFVAVKNDGTLIPWGEDGSNQGDAPVVPNLVDMVAYLGDIDPKYRAYAALSEDGTLYSWGGNNPAKRLPNGLTNIKALKTSDYVMGALSTDGQLTVATTPFEEPSDELVAQFTDVKDFFFTFSSFAILKNDGSVIGWDRNTNSVVPISTVQDQLTNVESLHGNRYAIVALKQDKSFVTWGSYGSRDLSSIQLENVESIHAGGGSLGAINSAGEAILWSTSSNVLGKYEEWTNYTDVSSIVGEQKLGVRYNNQQFEPFNTGATNNPELTQVSLFHATQDANIAVSSAGTHLWGNKSGGGLAGDADISDLVKVLPNEQAFAAIKSNGDVVSWGMNTSTVHESDIPFSNMQDIVSGVSSYALLTKNGELKTWGAPQAGGYIPEDIRADVTSGISEIASAGCSFIVRKANNTVQAWGGLDVNIVGAPTPSTLCGLGINELNISNAAKIMGSTNSYAIITSDNQVKLSGPYISSADRTYVESLTGVTKVLPLVMNTGYVVLTDTNTAVAIEYNKPRFEIGNVKDIYSSMNATSAVILKQDGTVASFSFSHWDTIETIDGVSDVVDVIASASKYNFIHSNGSGSVWPNFSTKGVEEVTEDGINLLTASQLVGASDSYVAKLASDEISIWGGYSNKKPAPPSATPIRLYGNTAGVIYQYDNDVIEDVVDNGVNAFVKRIENVERVIPLSRISSSPNSGYYILQKDGNVIALNDAVALPDYPSLVVITDAPSN